MLKFSREKLVQSHQAPWLMLDLLMLALLVVNLLWIIFDSLYATDGFQSLLSSISPKIVSGYAPLHHNFLFIDLAFVAVFFSEFCIRWFVAVKNKEYLRWYFFPFIHWYDLIGCIPLGAARIFRFLRVISILYRLHKYQIIDFKDSAIFRFVRFYYDVFIEELSDRIVVKVLTDAQQDISSGSSLLENIQSKVLAPRRDILNHWVSAIATHAGDSIANKEVGETVRLHIAESVSRAVKENSQVNTLNMVPLVGSGIEKLLESAVSDIVVQSIINLLKDMSPERVNSIVDHGLTAPTLSEQKLNQEVLVMVNESLDLVKEHVATQRWKTKLEER